MVMICAEDRNSRGHNKKLIINNLHDPHHVSYYVRQDDVYQRR